ncbi:LysR family transcriptional regulator [Herbidospora cretacea]|uniref:LysR family transcriptional regulator n=1 Tax=Herbidospora cretacea TaxID=28444 RepID=UPI0009DE2E4A|nr:LysR family transcriptional regulator [Herbidospora cretacea]
MQVRSVAAAPAGGWEAADDVQLDLPATGICSSALPERPPDQYRFAPDVRRAALYGVVASWRVVDLPDKRPEPFMSLASVDLNLLVALDALLTERNVTRAAKRTSVGQPAMSASLARLRKHFGDPLLVREGRSLQRTPLADTLVGPVREALSAAEAVLLRSPGFDPAKDKAAFTIMAADYVTIVLLGPLLESIAGTAPHIRICMRPVDADFADQLRSGAVDMVIIPTKLADRKLPFPHEPLFTDRYVLVVDRNHPDVRDSVTPEQATALRYVAFSGGTVSPITNVDLEALNVHIPVELTTESFAVPLLLLTGTRLATIAPERLALKLVSVAQLRIVEYPLSLSAIQEAMYWNPRDNDDLAHQWLRRRLIDTARSI